MLSQIANYHISGLAPDNSTTFKPKCQPSMSYNMIQRDSLLQQKVNGHKNAIGIYNTNFPELISKSNGILPNFSNIDLI